MHSGDLATIDATGSRNLVGRVEEMLIQGGKVKNAQGGAEISFCAGTQWLSSSPRR
jgi:hypothetical protein